MNKIITLAIIALMVIVAHAQEPAKYRITYDCDAQIVTGKPNTYRWTLDVGEKSAVFYNENNRAFNREMVELRATGDAMALIDQLPALGQKYPNKNDLQIVVDSQGRGKYSYYKQVLNSGLKYEEELPLIDWQLTDSTRTICEYECKQAIGYMYGRRWTVWYAPELPLSYGPYVLNGLPGLIMAAKDSDSLFDFVVVGIENAPEDAVISAFGEDGFQKCSRKRFLEMRSESEGISRDQLVDRILNQTSPDAKVVVYSIDGVNAKETSKIEVPKYNHLDKE